MGRVQIRGWKAASWCPFLGLLLRPSTSPVPGTRPQGLRILFKKRYSTTLLKQPQACRKTRMLRACLLARTYRGGVPAMSGLECRRSAPARSANRGARKRNFLSRP